MNEYEIAAVRNAANELEARAFETENKLKTEQAGVDADLIWEGLTAKKFRQMFSDNHLEARAAIQKCHTLVAQMRELADEKQRELDERNRLAQL